MPNHNTIISMISKEFYAFLFSHLFHFWRVPTCSKKLYEFFLSASMTFLKKNKCDIKKLPKNETLDFLAEAAHKSFDKEEYKKFLKDKVKCKDD